MTITETPVDSAPVLGFLYRDPTSEIFGSGFLHFNSAHSISGLAKIIRRDLHILAVISDDPGVGHFRNFITDLKANYPFVRFWALMNPQLESALTRYEFKAGHDMDQFGDMVDVMDWTNNL